MCLFLKPKFGNRKKATGRDGDFHAVFCGQFSISLHSSVQNWSLLLWWLYFLAMEVLDGQSQIITCFWLLSNFFWLPFFFFSFLLAMSPGVKAAKLWFSLPAITCRHPNVFASESSQLVWSWGEDWWRGRDWHVAKGGCCHLSLSKKG